jgi:protein eyes shut
VEGSSSTATTSTSESFLDFSTSKIFIGGIPDLSLLPHNSISGFPVPFRGCVRKFTINGRRIVLDENSIREARNIQDCDGTACGEDSCQLGTCWLDDKLQPHCKCPEYARGDRCEITESCRVIRCKNGGKCLRNGQCSCLNGWGGYYCEIATNKFATPSFKGNSYLIISPSRTPSKDKRNGPVYLQQNEQVNVMLNFSTISPDGLLFWQQSADHQYIGVGMQNGHVKVSDLAFI